MLPWKTVGMHVPSSFSSAICVQRMDVCLETAHTKQDQIYTSIYVYILVCTCLIISYQMICCANSSLDVASGGLSVEPTEERRHAHMAEGHKRRVETRRRRKAD